MKTTNSVLILIFLVIFSGLSHSQGVPQLIFYQGNLADANGNAIIESQNINFSIWNNITDGEKLWEENHNAVPFNQGLFSVMLGSVNPLSTDIFKSPCYLEITIAGETLSPRQQIASVPFAHVAASVSGKSNVFPSVGKVGIGTTNPSAKLQVNGSWSLGASDGLPGGADGRIYSGAGISYEGGGTDWAHHLSAFGGGDIVRFGTGDPGTEPNTKAVIKNNGRLGIGTTDPAHSLEVADTIYSSKGGFKFPDGTVQSTAATGGGVPGNGDITSVNAGDGLTGGATAGDATLNVAAGNGLSVSPDEISLNTTFTDNRYVNAGQANSVTNAMIENNAVSKEKIAPDVVSSISGVSNDGENIDLVAGDNVTITPDNVNKKITISAAGGSGTADNLGNHTATQNLNMNGNWVAGDGENEGIYVANNGNVGVGKNNPQTALDVKDNVTISGSGSEGGQLTLMDGDNQGGWEIDNAGQTGSEDLRIFRDKGHDDVYNAMTITNSGNVGIGTSSPEKRLHVKGGASGGAPATNTNLVVEDNDHHTINVLSPSDKSGAVSFGDAESSTAGEIKYSHSENAMRIKTNGTYKMIIKENGDVGIGHTNPSEKLDVAGTVKSQGDLVVNGAYRGNIGSNGGAPFPRPAFDTGWVPISHDQTISVVHNLGGNVDNYFVGLQFKDPYGIEINNKGIGGYMNERNKQGAWYQNLNNYSLEIYKQTEANWVDFFRIRIWIVK